MDPRCRSLAGFTDAEITGVVRHITVRPAVGHFGGVSRKTGFSDPLRCVFGDRCGRVSHHGAVPPSASAVTGAMRLLGATPWRRLIVCREATAFYTLDLDDALVTGLAMAAERKAAAETTKGADL